MSAGGWLRLGVGILLSGEIFRDWLFFGGALSGWALGLAGLFVALTALYFVTKF
jgi:hypothetical protein